MDAKNFLTHFRRGDGSARDWIFDKELGRGVADLGGLQLCPGVRRLLMVSHSPPRTLCDLP